MRIILYDEKVTDISSTTACESLSAKDNDGRLCKYLHKQKTLTACYLKTVTLLTSSNFKFTFSMPGNPPPISRRVNRYPTVLA